MEKKKRRTSDDRVRITVSICTMSWTGSIVLCCTIPRVILFLGLGEVQRSYETIRVTIIQHRLQQWTVSLLRRGSWKLTMLGVGACILLAYKILRGECEWSTATLNLKATMQDGVPVDVCREPELDTGWESSPPTMSCPQRLPTMRARAACSILFNSSDEMIPAWPCPPHRFSALIPVSGLLSVCQDIWFVGFERTK